MLTTEFDPVTSSMLMNFTVDTGDITKSFQFDRFGAAATQAGLSFDRDQTFNLDATLRAQGAFNFGLDLTKAASNPDSVFFADGVRNASILAGYNTTADVTATAAGENPDTQIGDVAIIGDWIASNLVAGAAWNDNFATAPITSRPVWIN